MNLTSIQKTADDIKAIKIQGATNIAKFAFQVMKDDILLQKFSSKEFFQKFVHKGSKILMETRATEPMMFNGMKYVLNILKEKIKDSTIDLEDLKQEVAFGFDEFLDMIKREKEIRANLGEQLINDGDNIFTHCHSSSAIGILKQAHGNRKKIHVYNDETRPLYQGRQTSRDLAHIGIQNTMVTDGSSAFFVDNMYENHVHINKVIIGCDAIRLNGDVLNKVGSFGIGLAAHHSKIPVYIAGSLTKVDTTNEVQIEQRSANEVRTERPEKLEIMNYAFDMIPAKFITGIITEFGIIKPKDIKKAVKKHYPRMLK